MFPSFLWCLKILCGRIQMTIFKSQSFTCVSFSLYDEEINSFPSTIYVLKLKKYIIIKCTLQYYCNRTCGIDQKNLDHTVKRTRKCCAVVLIYTIDCILYNETFVKKKTVERNAIKLCKKENFIKERLQRWKMCIFI